MATKSALKNGQAKRGATSRIPLAAEPADEPVEIKIAPENWQRVSVPIRGSAPLVQNRWSDDAIAEIRRCADNAPGFINANPGAQKLWWRVKKVPLFWALIEAENQATADNDRAMDRGGRKPPFWNPELFVEFAK